MAIGDVSIPLIPVAIALGAAGAMHAMLRLAEHWEARRAGRSRDMIMLPALLAVALVIATGADWLDSRNPDLLRQAGFAVFLGLIVGQGVPRPPRRRR